jgi:menaquinone-dependent protoporphyrinogen IX oxidase
MNVDEILKRSVVIYCTRYGSSAEVAEALADGLGIHAKKVSDIQSAADLAAYDLVFLGAPIYYDDVLDEMKVFIQAFYPELDEKKKILFTVFGAIRGKLQRDYATNFAGYFSKAPILTINFMGRATRGTMSDKDWKYMQLFYANRLKMEFEDFDYFGQNDMPKTIEKIRATIVEKF